MYIPIHTYTHMSIYPIPISHAGLINGSFNVSDFKTSPAVSSATKLYNDGRYLRVAGTVSSSALTSFTNGVNISGVLSLGNSGMTVSGKVSTALLTVSTDASFNTVNASGLSTLVSVRATTIGCNSIATTSIDASGSIQSLQASDSLNTSQVFATNMTFDYTAGMVYYLSTSNITQSQIFFANIPTTPKKSYIFTFILKPSTASNAWYLKPSGNYVRVNGGYATVSGIGSGSTGSVVLPSTYTYIIQQRTIFSIGDTVDTPVYFAVSSVSAY
jgi:hypothetical protein